MHDRSVKRKVSLPSCGYHCVSYLSVGDDISKTHLRCMSAKKAVMDGGLLVFLVQIYVSVLNTIHSLWSVAQAGHCVLPRHEESKVQSPL